MTTNKLFSAILLAAALTFASGAFSSCGKIDDLRKTIEDLEQNDDPEDPDDPSNPDPGSQDEYGEPSTTHLLPSDEIRENLYEYLPTGTWEAYFGDPSDEGNLFDYALTEDGALAYKKEDISYDAAFPIPILYILGGDKVTRIELFTSVGATLSGVKKDTAMIRSETVFPGYKIQDHRVLSSSEEDDLTMSTMASTNGTFEAETQAAMFATYLNAYKNVEYKKLLQKTTNNKTIAGVQTTEWILHMDWSFADFMEGEWYIENRFWIDENDICYKIDAKAVSGEEVTERTLFEVAKHSPCKNAQEFVRTYYGNEPHYREINNYPLWHITQYANEWNKSLYPSDFENCGLDWYTHYTSKGYGPDDIFPAWKGSGTIYSMTVHRDKDTIFDGVHTIEVNVLNAEEKDVRALAATIMAVPYYFKGEGCGLLENEDVINLKCVTSLEDSELHKNSEGYYNYDYVQYDLVYIKDTKYLNITYKIVDMIIV